MIDVLLRGGTVVDGSGSPPGRADVAITSGRIVQVAAQIEAQARRVVDVAGRIVAPGFVDIHTHSDLTVLSGPGAFSKVRQGVTTEVVGNCGLGLAPLLPGADHAAIRSAVSYLDMDSSLEVTWSSFREYLDAVRIAGPALNIASFVAHLPLHAGVVGFGEGAAGPRDIEIMSAELGTALDEGGVGLSTGLAYSPLCFADDEELTALARVVESRGKVFAWHILDYGDELLESVRQALRIARNSGVRTQISHLTAVGRRNWHKIPEALELIDAARDEGLTVGADLYPYTAGNAPLSQVLPAWAQVGGNSAVRGRLADRSTRDRILREWEDRPLGWDEIIFNAAPVLTDPRIGSSFEDLGTRAGTSGGEAVLEVLAEYGGGAMMVAHGRSDANVRQVFEHPCSVVASDGQALDPMGVTGRGLPHPRSYGTFPRYLSRYRGDDLADAIRRCTSAPADVLGIDRGRLVAGAAADLVVLDLDALQDGATFREPHTFPTGIDAVFVAGVPVFLDGQDTGSRPGAVLTSTPQGDRS